VAKERNLAGIIVTCHNPPIDGWAPQVRMASDQLANYVAMVEHARREWQGEIDVRLGLECDYVPGMEDQIAEQLTSADFHYVLGSIHPDFPQYVERFPDDDIVRFQGRYFEQLAMAAETGLFDTLSHPDLVKNYRPQDWDVDRLMDTISLALDRIAATGVAMELNTSGLHKRVREMNPGPLMLAQMAARNIPVTIGADAHVPQRVGADFDQGLRLLEEAGYTYVYITLQKERREISIADALQSMQTVSEQV
jgi:histidinol-phosphatase (PHP family)